MVHRAVTRWRGGVEAGLVPWLGTGGARAVQFGKLGSLDHYEPRKNALAVCANAQNTPPFMVFFGIILPWLVVFFLIAGLTAGLSAALAVRRRLPPRNAGRKLPPGVPAVKRPRGTQQNRQQREQEDG